MNLRVPLCTALGPALLALSAMAPATGICDDLRRAPRVLELWQSAGHELGNHTADHLDLNRAAPEAWKASVSAATTG